MESQHGVELIQPASASIILVQWRLRAIDRREKAGLLGVRLEALYEHQG